MTLEELPELKRALAEKNDEILLSLLSQYSEKWRHYSDQIWSTGSVFIPLSLSGVALGIDDFYRTIAVALFSILLIWIWYSISSKLRKLIDRSLCVYAHIESSVLKLKQPCLEHGIDELIPKSKDMPIRKVRRLIPIGVSLAWALIVALSFAKMNLLKS